MIDLVRVLRSAKTHEREHVIDLTTPWGEALDCDHVLPEHPRPTMMRGSYTMLNGMWEYAVVPRPETAAGASSSRAGTEIDEATALDMVSSAAAPSAYDGTILVPFSPEAPLSGVRRILQPDELLWYRRELTVPEMDGTERMVLHFEAVDWACAVFIDGALAATHAGGYLPFDVDVTALVSPGATCELTLCAFDPTDAGVQPRGKQRLSNGGIWYTPQSGIWQSVWYEILPAAHISALALNGDAEGLLRIDAELSDTGGILTEGSTLEVTVLTADGTTVAHGEFPVSADNPQVSGTLCVPSPSLWSPDDPFLYGALAILHPAGGVCEDDAVRSYCAFRTVEVARDRRGVARFMLNGRPLFLRGVLDQGYWPDGLMTAPSDAALVHDIRSMKSAGFNMLRKHIKVESARWYYHCDRLGMLVWQDAVSGGSPYSPWYTSRIPTLFQASWGRFRDDTPRHRAALSAGDEAFRTMWTESCTGMVKLLRGHPSVVTWVLFNEGWGQFDARQAAETVHELDPTRPIDATSGWYDQRCGDYLSHHNYFRPLIVGRDRRAPTGYAGARGCRAFVLSEFGGWTQLVEGHASSPRAYGYGDFPDIEAWRRAVAESLEEASSLEPQCMVGFVYTQLSDVEDELNGLLTYDRRVNKLRD